MLEIQDISDLHGSVEEIEVFERQKGSGPSSKIIVPSLTAGKEYWARIASINNFGQGPYSTKDQKGGIGVLPFSLVVTDKPPSPNLSVEALSNSQLGIRFSYPENCTMPPQQEVQSIDFIIT